MLPEVRFLADAESRRQHYGSALDGTILAGIAATVPGCRVFVHVLFIRRLVPSESDSKNRPAEHWGADCANWRHLGYYCGSNLQVLWSIFVIALIHTAEVGQPWQRDWSDCNARAVADGGLRGKKWPQGQNQRIQ